MAPEPVVPSEKLPHTPPALLLARAEVDLDRSLARGSNFTADMEKTAGPDPMPQMLLMEMMSQTAGLILPDGTSSALVAAIDDMTLNPHPGPAGEITTEAHLERRLGNLFVFRCRAESGGSVLAAGSIVLRAL